MNIKNHHQQLKNGWLLAIPNWNNSGNNSGQSKIFSRIFGSVIKYAFVSILLVSTNIAAKTGEVFHRIASIPTTANLPAIGKPWATATSAEIIAATDDGNTVVYTDTPLGGIGFISIANPTKPEAAGFVRMQGEPTGLVVTKKTVLVGVNTSQSFLKPSGKLVAISLQTHKPFGQCELGGQPDSVAVSKDGKWLAIAVENERDSDFNNGDIPQLPAGFVAILSLENGVPICQSLKKVSLSGLAEVAPSDPEPEYVDFNSNNEIVVTLQENNHLVVIDANKGQVIADFSAGSVDLDNVDLHEDGALTFDAQQKSRKREPDAVKWLDTNRFVTANEGGYEGGSRGFTIFNKQGEVLFDSGLAFEYAIASAGHYPEKRSANKGVEPEGIEVSVFNGQRYIFVLSERGSVVGVYKDTDDKPELVQLLPSGVGPESAIAIPSRNLLVTANEKDLLKKQGARAHVMIYQLTQGQALYPQIKSVMQDGRPIGWGALSGMVADLNKPGVLYAVNDGFYRKQPTIFTIDANQKPAKIIEARLITKDGLFAEKLNLQGITSDGKGGFWVVSAGQPSKSIPYALYHVNSKGQLKNEINLSPSLLANEKLFVAQGITQIDKTLWVAMQGSQEDNPDNTANTAMLLAYNTEKKSWGAVLYPLEDIGNDGTSISEITAYGDYVYIIERDNQVGDKAKIKHLYKVPQSKLKPAKLGADLPVVNKELVADLLPDLKKGNGYVIDNVDGLAIDVNGRFYFVSNNHGVDNSSGETLFFTKDNLR